LSKIEMSILIWTISRGEFISVDVIRSSEGKADFWIVVRHQVI